MEKSLRLLMLLAHNRSYSCEEIAERFQMSKRSVYRHLNQIENSGFVLDRSNGRYKLVKDDRKRSLTKLLHFTQEEAYILYKSLSNLEASDTLLTSLIKKLHTLYDFQALKQVQFQDNIEKVKLLSQAISSQKQVVLKQYQSSNSQSVSDRKVEPFEFMSDYKAIWCLDIADNTVKQFKISRITEVISLSGNWQFKELHQSPFTDAFRMAADKPIANVKAILSLKAYNLIKEEYPLSEIYIKEEDDNSYYLDIPIADYHGIGRFVLGLPEDIRVKKPSEFKEFLRKKKEKYTH